MSRYRRNEALAFRIWQFTTPREWNVTLHQIAEALGESPASIRASMRHRGWLHRIRSGSIHPEPDPAPVSVVDALSA